MAPNYLKSASTTSDGIAIGKSARAENEGFAIGTGTISTGGITIGDYVGAGGGEINIGGVVRVTGGGDVYLGSSTSTVHIPGSLVVDKDAYLNQSSSRTSVRTDYGSPQTIEVGRPHLSGYSNWFSNYISLDLEDDVLVPGSYHSPSDRRLKNVGDVFKGGLAEIKKLKLYHYTFKKDKYKTPRVGVTAQDLQKIFPDAVIKGEDGFLRIRLEDMFYVVVNAIKELDAKITAMQKNEIKELRTRAEKLEKENKELEKRLELLEKKLK